MQDNIDKKPVFIINAHKGPVISLSISNNNRFLLSSSGQFIDYYGNIVFTDNSICLWDLNTGKLLNKWKNTPFEINESGYINTAFINYSLFLTTGPGSIINIISIKNSNINKKLGEENHNIKSMKFVNSKNMLLTGGDYRDKSIKLWDINSGKCINTYKSHQWDVDSVDVSPDADKIISTSSLYDDKPILLWEFNKSLPVKKLGSINMRITSCIFISNKYILSTGEDKVIRLWDTYEGKTVKAYEGTEGYPYAVKYMFKKNIIVAGASSFIKGMDNYIYFWDLKESKLLNRLFKHSSGINKLIISNGEKLIITGCNDGKIYIWKNPFV